VFPGGSETSRSQIHFHVKQNVVNPEARTIASPKRRFRSYLGTRSAVWMERVDICSVWVCYRLTLRALRKRFYSPDGSPVLFASSASTENWMYGSRSRRLETRHGSDLRRVLPASRIIAAADLWRDSSQRLPTRPRTAARRLEAEAHRDAWSEVELCMADRQWWITELKERYLTGKRRQYK